MTGFNTARVGQTVNVSSALVSTRYIFGPFVEGEIVDALRLFLGTNGAAALHQIRIDVRAFAAKPPDTEAGFEASGRSLLGVAAIAAGLRLPVASNLDKLAYFDLPLAFTADQTERWLGVQFLAESAVDSDGSIWLVRGTLEELASGDLN